MKSAQESRLKLNVKVGEIFARVEVTDCDKATRERIVRHIIDCPECIRMIYKKGRKK